MKKIIFIINIIIIIVLLSIIIMHNKKNLIIRHENNNIINSKNESIEMYEEEVYKEELDIRNINSPNNQNYLHLNHIIIEDDFDKKNIFSEDINFNYTNASIDTTNSKFYYWSSENCDMNINLLYEIDKNPFKEQIKQSIYVLNGDNRKYGGHLIILTANGDIYISETLDFVSELATDATFLMRKMELHDLFFKDVEGIGVYHWHGAYKNEDLILMNDLEGDIIAIKWKDSFKEGIYYININDGDMIGDSASADLIWRQISNKSKDDFDNLILNNTSIGDIYKDFDENSWKNNLTEHMHYIYLGKLYENNDITSSNNYDVILSYQNNRDSTNMLRFIQGDNVFYTYLPEPERFLKTKLSIYKNYLIETNDENTIDPYINVYDLRDFKHIWGEFLYGGCYVEVKNDGIHLFTYIDDINKYLTDGYYFEDNPEDVAILENGGYITIYQQEYLLTIENDEVTFTFIKEHKDKTYDISYT